MKRELVSMKLTGLQPIAQPVCSLAGAGTSNMSRAPGHFALLARSTACVARRTLSDRSDGRPAAKRYWWPAIASRINRWRAGWVRYQAAREARATVLHLAGLDDRTLQDLGFSRADVDWALNLPIRIDAARALSARTWLAKQPENDHHSQVLD